MDTLKICFVDFWPNFKDNDNYFYNLLSKEYNVVLDSEDPDLLFYSYDYTGNPQHFKYNHKRCKKIYYTGECSKPDFNQCHHAFTFEHMEDDRNYRLPLWGMHINWFNRPHDDDRDQSYMHDPQFLLNKNNIKVNKKYFCSFIANQPKGKRVSFVPKLLSKREVHCMGGLYNNTNQRVHGRGDQIWKILALKPFKFNVSFENTSSDGYTTEKIIHPMFVNTIPLYWGNERVGEDFNKKSFLSLHDYSSEEEFIDKILEIDNDNQKYEEILNEPWFIDNKFPDFILPKNVLKHFKEKILK